jgi:hypothetical protein
MLIRNNSLLLWGVIAWSSALYPFGQRTFFDACQRTDVPELVTIMDFALTQPDKRHCQWSLTTWATQSFDNGRITSFLFGATPVVFTGSLIPSRRTTDILADYFGLPLDFASVVTFNPSITNFFINLDYYGALDCCIEGLYWWLHLPIVETVWDLHLHEQINSPGVLGYPAGYFSSEDIVRSVSPTALPSAFTTNVLMPDVETYFQGKLQVGDMLRPLSFGRVFKKQNKFLVADLRVQVGWQWLQDCERAGCLYGFIGIPTTNRPQAHFLFEALAGNAGRWQLGGGVTIRNEYECVCGVDDVSIACYLDCNISHLFAANQRRSFDFTSAGPGSRYIALAAVNAASSNLLLNGVAPATQYAGKIYPAINNTTLDVQIGVNAQVIATAALTACWKDCTTMTVGYSFFGRTAEVIKKRTQFQANRFVFKGDAQLYGFRVTDNMPIPLNISEHTATLTAAQAPTNFITGNGFANDNIDFAQPATDAAAVVLNQLTPTDSVTFGIPAQQVNGSLPAVFIEDANLNIASGLLPRAIANLLFASIEWKWVDDHACFYPAFEMGGSLDCARSSASSNSACSSWSVWLKGTLTYF